MKSEVKDVNQAGVHIGTGYSNHSDYEVDRIWELAQEINKEPIQVQWDHGKPGSLLTNIVLVQSN